MKTENVYIILYVHYNSCFVATTNYLKFYLLHKETEDEKVSKKSIES